MSENKIIVLDVDETIRDMMSPVLKMYNLVHGTKFTKDDIDNYDFRNVLTEIKDMKEYFYNNAEMCFVNSDMFEGTIESLLELQKMGYHIRITTNQFKGLEIFTLYWLNKHTIPYDSIVITNDKSWVDGEFIVDDNLDMIKSSPCKYKILVKRAWNKDGWNIYSPITNISELPAKIKEITGE
jgi:5'(3')-deoxyribonucleotidase